MLLNKMNEVLDSLTERERTVLIERFGLIDGKPKTLEEVGLRFKVTRERVRQIEAKKLEVNPYEEQLAEQQEIELGVKPTTLKPRGQDFLPHEVHWKAV